MHIISGSNSQIMATGLGSPDHSAHANLSHFAHGHLPALQSDPEIKANTEICLQKEQTKERFTIICPVHNEAAVIPLFYERILPVLNELGKEYDVNLVFSNNASSDRTLAAIEQLRLADPRVFVISLSANVGYQRSLECGLRNTKADLYAFIDVDCEDPPEMLIEFAASYKEGFDVVYGERADREEPEYVKFMRKVFYRVLKALADEEVILDMAEFSLMSKEVRDAIIEDKTSFPFIRASIGRVGFRRKGITYKRQKRIAGESHYNFLSMSKFAIAGILSSSTLFLRIPIYTLPFWLLAIFALPAAYILTANPWFLLAGFFVFAAYLGITVSFIGIYVARIHKNTLGRPNFTIDRKNSFLQP